jgi:hypothetical protein
VDHAEQPKDYTWIGNAFVFGVIAWTLVFPAPVESDDRTEAPKKPPAPVPARVPVPRPAPVPASAQTPPAPPAPPAPEPVRAQAPATAEVVTAPQAPAAVPFVPAPVIAPPVSAPPSTPYHWAPAPQRLVVAPLPKKRFDWLQIGITTLVIAIIVACIAEAYLQIKSENQTAAQARPHVAVRVSAIKHLEGEFLAQETVDDYGDAPAINTQLITVTIPEATTAGDFFRRADAGQTNMTPANLGFVLPGKPQSYEAPIVAPDPNDFTIDRNLKNGQAVTVVGRVVYQDSRGRTYHTDFCATGTASGPFQDCAEYNFQK